MSTYKYFGTRKLLLGKNDDITRGPIMAHLESHSTKLINSIKTLEDVEVFVLYRIGYNLDDRIKDDYVRGVFVNGCVATVKGSSLKGYFLNFQQNPHNTIIPSIALSNIYDIIIADDINLQKDGSDVDNLDKMKTFTFYPLKETDGLDKGIIGFKVDHYDPFNAYKIVKSEFSGKPVKLDFSTFAEPGRLETITRDNHL